MLSIHRPIVVSLALATSAWATPSSESSLSHDAPVRLADSHGAVPVRLPPERPRFSGGSVDFFLLGLGLTAGGLVLGGGGFAVLYGCREGTTCHGSATTVLGWALAAPGIVPLAVGLAMMYASSKSHGRVEATPSSSAGQWALGLSFLPGGAVAVAGRSF